MKSVSLFLALGLGAAIVAASSCGGKKPAQTAPTPNADSAAAADRARQDSIDAASVKPIRSRHSRGHRKTSVIPWRP